MSILSKRFILTTLVITFFYVLLVTYSMNLPLLKSTILGDYSLIYKIKLLLVLAGGMWTAMSISGLILLFLIAVLTGANLSLLFDKVTALRKFDKLHFVVGGNSLLGIVGSGCAACGLPIISLLGLSGSLMFLPFHGAELSYISFVLLAVSFYLLVRSRNQSCAVDYSR